MSDLLYYTTAVTKGKKPKVLFLNDDSAWTFNLRCATQLTLKEARSLAKYEPTHCLFVEACNELESILRIRYDEGKLIISAEEFYDIVTKLGCQTVSTRKKKKSKKEEVRFDDVSTTDFLGTESKPVSEIAANQEEERNYIVYRYYSEDNDVKRVHFTSTHQYHITIFKQTANCYTFEEAKELVKSLGEILPYDWHLSKFFTPDMIKQLRNKSIDNWRDRPVSGRI